MNKMICSIAQLYYKEAVLEGKTIEEFVFRQNDIYFDIFSDVPVFSLLRLLGIKHYMDEMGYFFIRGERVADINGMQPCVALARKDEAYTIHYQNGITEIITYPNMANRDVLDNDLKLYNDVLYIKIKTFSQFDSEQLKNYRIRKLVIDLRGNEGGNVRKMKSVLEHFIDGILFYLVHQGEKFVVHSNCKYKLNYEKVILLVDRYTASSAEFFTASMREAANGIVLGEETYGKWVAQELIKVENYYVKVPKYKYATPLYKEPGMSKGLYPDIICRNEEEFYHALKHI